MSATDGLLSEQKCFQEITNAQCFAIPLLRLRE